VNVDVSHNQEFLRYRLCITQGGKNDGLITDDDGKVILDESSEVSTRCRECQWPREGQSVAVGDHEHTLILSFVRAVEYTYKVTLHNEDGSIKRWVKDCTYTRERQTDRATIGLTVSVI